MAGKPLLSILFLGLTVVPIAVTSMRCGGQGLEAADDEGNHIEKQDAGCMDAGCDASGASPRCPTGEMVTDRHGELRFGFVNTSRVEVFLAAHNLCAGPDSVDLYLAEIWMGGGAECSCGEGTCGRECEAFPKAEAEPIMLSAGAQIVSPNVGDYGYRSVDCPFDCFIFGEWRTKSCYELVPIPSGRYHVVFCVSCAYMIPRTECWAVGHPWFCPEGFTEVSKEVVVLPTDTTVYVKIANSDLPAGCVGPPSDGGADTGGEDAASDAGVEKD